MLFYRLPIIFIFILAGLIGSITLITLALTYTGADNSAHSEHIIKGKNIGSIQLAYVEHSANLIREGDAKSPSEFKINSESLEPDDNCEFCTEVIYNPGKEGVAAVAYQVDKMDLTLSKRIVFFAKGQNGGEQLSFVAGGKNIANGSGVIENVDGDLFPDQGFALMTKKITLYNHWKRYEISLISNDLWQITHPFGFIIMAGNSSETQFFLKGITFDDRYPNDPIPI
jgi:hypothetical protein